MNICRLSMGIFIAMSSVTACSRPPLDGNLELQSLTDEELVHFCEDQTWEIVRSLDYQKLPIGCTLAGFAAAADAKSGTEAWATCHKADDACKMQPEEIALELPTPSTITAGCTKFPEIARTCKGLTVSEYDSYMREERSNMSGMNGAVHCSSIVVELHSDGKTYIALVLDPRARVARDVLEAKCPALLYGP